MSKPGDGSGFAKLKAKFSAEGKKSPGGLAAAIGRRKYGKKKMAAWAAKGKEKKKEKK